MPTLARFYGIVIKMYFLNKEHNPPHFHAIYGEEVAAIEIKTGNVLDGYLPPKALSLIEEWLMANRDELQKIWDTQEFKTLEPLK